MFTVCGNTWRMLADTRFRAAFRFHRRFRHALRHLPRLRHVDPVRHERCGAGQIEQRLLLTATVGQGDMQFDLTRRLAAEALGTLILVMAVVGSGIMAEKLAGGNQALALLCNTIATGAVLFVIITIFAPISGAHFNPAVSLVMLLSRRARSAARPLAYVVVQIVGGCVGAVLAHLMFGLDLSSARLDGADRASGNGRESSSPRSG